MNVVLLGPQGSGKGTQADMLEERLEIAHLASGDVLRAARESDTELGATVRRFYDAGELVPDAITIELILDSMRRHMAGGVILDGFPRNLAQARALDAALAAAGQRIDAVVELAAPLDVVRERLVGRRTCRAQGHIYNVVTNPPATAGVCDVDGSELYQRPDDNPQAIAKRLEIWARENGELTRYYGDRGILHRVDADRTPEAVLEDAVALLGRLGARPVAEG